MKRVSRLSIALAAICILSGCAIFESRAKSDAPTNVNVSEINAGYALLYDFVFKEKLERISETSKATANELEALAKGNPPLNLKAMHLPRIEQAARESIDKETSKDILSSKDVALEFNMVSSQLAGLNYAAHLARNLAAVETNPQRKTFLQRTDRKYTELHAQAYKMLFTRYQR